ncbi:MAG: hypothetical protein WC998_00725 [Candidatus Paceibacterota bacterium]|jgi:hypothetical protein
MSSKYGNFVVVWHAQVSCGKYFTQSKVFIEHDSAVEFYDRIVPKTTVIAAAIFPLKDSYLGEYKWDDVSGGRK